MRHEDKLNIYLDLLEKWQKAINLVSFSTLATRDLARTRHIDDSLQLLPLLPTTAKSLYDLGTGAGFPGLVLAIARPDLDVHLIESDGKKCEFLRTVSRETGAHVTIHRARVEDVTLPSPSVITARGLADLATLLRLTAQWWEPVPETSLLFLKGAKAQEELADAEKLYTFKHKIFPSKTDPKGQVLSITEVKKRICGDNPPAMEHPP